MTLFAAFFLSLLVLTLSLGTPGSGEPVAQVSARIQPRPLPVRKLKAEDRGTLLSVQLVHRHGDRSPVHVQPSTAALWAARGLAAGELTAIGRAQLRSFGSFLRQRYIAQEAFLDPNYVPSHLYVRSTDVDRCLASVESLLSTLYPGAPVPIHTVPEDWDELLQPSDKCASYRASYPSVIAANGHIAQAQFAENGLMNLLMNVSGWQTTIRAANLFSVSLDNAVCQTQHNLTVHPTITENLAEIRTFVKKLYYEQYAIDPSKPKDRRGPVGAALGRQMLTNFHAHRIPPAEAQIVRGPPRLIVYSAHDTTLISLLATLSPHLLTPSSDHLLPPYAASVVMELRELDGEQFVHAYWGASKRTGENPELTEGWDYELTPFKLWCPTPELQCPLDSFTDYVQSQFVTRQDEGCCLRVQGFYDLGCNNYTSPAKYLPYECGLYRRICPLVSCDTNQVLDFVTLACIPRGSATAWMWSTIILAVALLLALVAQAPRLREYWKRRKERTTYLPVWTTQR